ncbi:hypothetical protein PCANC_18263 [Puccinia coronata f. sp. avenae]|uniref:Uncharacterized protein n=1 Tax=Puccinia coronata f. sp. avenae TaxID=200324 RepID=A0A2N5UQY7_9BASI|nr:hypothetical protein PCANC_27950 [Puccinia coronata f. sp. avenae]PLW29309.1 hypothetical protein PCANC_24979 [Puccinia coronata f. sp. avenae]PLW40162.1 hypothetical protein PCANC_18263 [Puccinia coronata f. sp. avenae]
MKIPHTIFKLRTKPHLKLQVFDVETLKANTSQSPNQLPPPGFPPHLNPSNPSGRIDTSSNHHSSSQPPNMGSTMSNLGPDVFSNQSDGLHAYEDTIPALPPPILFPSSTPANHTTTKAIANTTSTKGGAGTVRNKLMFAIDVSTKPSSYKRRNFTSSIKGNSIFFP